MSSHTEKYKPHAHKLVNINDLRQYEHESGGINQKVAVALTRGVGTMWTAYSFVLLALIGLFAILGVFSPIVALLVAWVSQTLIQLVLLPVIMVGQNTLNHHAELQADETFQTAAKIFKDVETIMKQNNEQFEVLEAQNKVLTAHYEELLRQTSMLNTALTPRRRPMKQEAKRDD